ncbi:MAG: hypothetical protein NVS3B1_20520 [Marmoricola sp.]
MRILGLCGRKGSGKDEAAKALIADGWVRMAFADPLRDMLRILNPIVRTDGLADRWAEVYDREGYDRLKQLPEARRLMQTLGTEVIRDFFGQDAWANMLLRTVANMPPATRVVVTDVRFNNEARALRAAGATIINVVRPDLGAPDDAHISEVGVAQALVDRTLWNVGSIDDLHRHVRSIISP